MVNQMNHSTYKSIRNYFQFNVLKSFILFFLLKIIFFISVCGNKDINLSLLPVKHPFGYFSVGRKCSLVKINIQLLLRIFFFFCDGKNCLLKGLEVEAVAWNFFVKITLRNEAFRITFGDMKWFKEYHF